MDFTCFGSFCSRRQTKYENKSKAQFFNPSLLLCKAFTSVKISTYLVLFLVIIFRMRFLKTVTWMGLDWEAPDRKMFSRSSRSFASSSFRQDSSKRSDQDLVLFTNFIKDEDVSMISLIAFPDNVNALSSSPCLHSHFQTRSFWWVAYHQHKFNPMWYKSSAIELDVIFGITLLPRNCCL